MVICMGDSHSGHELPAETDIDTPSACRHAMHVPQSEIIRIHYRHFENYGKFKHVFFIRKRFIFRQRVVLIRRLVISSGPLLTDLLMVTKLVAERSHVRWNDIAHPFVKEQPNKKVKKKKVTMGRELVSSVILVCFVAVTSAKRNFTTVNSTQLANEMLIFSEDLFASDANGAGELIRLNLQNKTTFKNFNDTAPEPLFSETPFSRLLEMPTYAALVALSDNYELNVSAPENVTSHEQDEEDRFIEAIMSTEVVNKTHQFLVAKGKVSADSEKFRDFLKELWFGFYPRDRKVVGSCGFEHVFLGELKKSIIGLHSWIRYSTEEKNGNMNYLGYLNTVSLGHNLLVELPFRWKDTRKPISSILVGPSPELEVALYTVCFCLFPNRKCPVQASGKSFNVQTFSTKFNGKRYIGTAYPTL